jgi:sulfatase maturation enzyme AslB (radical SAM superfamily)
MFDIEKVVKRWSEFTYIETKIEEVTFMPIWIIKHNATNTTFELRMNGYLYDAESWMDNWLREKVQEERDKIIDKLCSPATTGCGTTFSTIS